MPGDGTPKRSYLYAADLAIWLWTLLFSELKEGTNPSVVNVGSSEAVSIPELSREVTQELRPGLKIEVARKPAPGTPPLQYVPDVRPAEERYGLRQTIGLRDSIRRTADWYLE